MSNDKLAEALRDLRNVLCDPRGKCCINGSEGDRIVVETALSKLDELQAHASESAQAAEPVAWMTPAKNYFGSFEGCTDACNGAPIPLYTHLQPAQDAKDAARYRWLKENDNLYLPAEDVIDEAMDAMAKESAND